jgi:hypothetical protein
MKEKQVTFMCRYCIILVQPPNNGCAGREICERCKKFAVCYEVKKP